MVASRNTCAFYVRVSSEAQNLDNQKPAMVQLAQARGLEVVSVYEEKVSAAAKTRPAYEKMLAEAHRGRWSHLIVWAIDRFGRSMGGNLAAVLELDRIGVQVISVRETWLDTGGPVRPLLIAVFSWAAEQERRRLSERTIAGIERARRAGKVIGRPRVTVDLEAALALRGAGLPIRKIAKQLKVGAATVHRALRQHDGMIQNPHEIRPSTSAVSSCLASVERAA